VTYLTLDLLFLVPVGAVLLAAARRGRLDRRWWGTTAVVLGLLLVLTAAFDSVMIGADLFRYGASALTGLRVGLTPIEDFAWPLAVALALPALWELLGARRDKEAARED
jgi:lycopene cyclase domain-containing protein